MRARHLPVRYRRIPTQRLRYRMIDMRSRRLHMTPHTNRRLPTSNSQVLRYHRVLRRLSERLKGTRPARRPRLDRRHRFCGNESAGEGRRYASFVDGRRARPLPLVADKGCPEVDSVGLVDLTARGGRCVVRVGDDACGRRRCRRAQDQYYEHCQEKPQSHGSPHSASNTARATSSSRTTAASS
jgi:hypothetical protein